MTGDQIAQLAYLGLLGAAIAGFYFSQTSQTLGKTVQQAMAWVLIFVGAVAAVGLWQDVRRTVVPTQAVMASGQIVVPVAPDGHYYLTLAINGTPLEFVVDTGASEMVLTREDAERVGIAVDELSFLGTARTANGEVRTAAVWLDEVTLGPIVDTEVRAVVNDGDLFGSLLGMGYLGRFQSIEIRGQELILTR